MAQSLSNLPIGAKIKFGKHSVNGETAQPITWLVVAKNHSEYPTNSVTLLTEKIIDFRCFDAREPNNTNYKVIQENGYGRYAYSNIGQWLNSDASAGQWYIAQHTYDQSPTADYVYNNSPYAQRPGFLNSFSNGERTAILNTTVTTTTTKWNGNVTDTIVQRVFIPSSNELTKWTYFLEGASKVCYPTNQVITYSTVTPTQSATACLWRLRDHYGDSIYETAYVGSNGNITTDRGVSAYYGYVGIRPALNLSSTLSISDTTDSDGAYTVVWNSAPPMPTTFNVPTSIYGGKSTTLSWSNVTDPDGDSVTYQLEQSLNGGEYTTIYSGTNLGYTTTIAYGTTSVQFRVKAVDSVGASSGYNLSTSRTVINNNAPTISDADRNLGNKNAEFTQTYTIFDSNGNVVTVTEAIDGVRVRSYTATINATNTFSVTGATWLTLTNGSHTMTITATDGIDSVVRTYTFVKSIDSFTIQTTVAKSVSTRPTRIKLVVGREIPVGAMFKVEVCNNGFDSTKTWEDATSAVTSGLVHIFSNTTKVSANWGVLIRVTVNRNGTSGACYVNSIGGNFE